ncbi:hypothetical protein CK203_076880 [Vitis vinifera]|uniref:Uncharacterized protein n=1 Tax=Vitis vinifera TaxID=29760 RepID=A0A438ET34_VITVI|nr:hypothetical protein CK203_076880 [Vitis vinifera]
MWLSNLGSHARNSISTQPNPLTPTNNGVPSNSSRPPTTSVPYIVFPSDHGTPSEVRNAKLVVAILIATATYQAVLSSPYDVPHILVYDCETHRKVPYATELVAAIVAMFFTYETGLFIIALRSGIGIQFEIPTICMPSLLQGLSTIIKMTRVVWKELMRGSQPTNMV